LWNEDIKYRIKPHKWQKEIDAQAAGKIVQGKPINGIHWQKSNCWAFNSKLMVYRIKPEPVMFEEVKQAYKDGKKIQRQDSPTGVWCDVVIPMWTKTANYRVKPEGKVIYVNEYGSFNSPYFTKESAVINAGRSAKRIAVKYQEILDN